MPVLTILIPIFNEEILIDELVSRVHRSICLFVDENHIHQSDVEVVFINDGSKDNSLDILRSHCQKNNNYKIINLSRNFGHQFAITAGLDNARGQNIVIMDGDLQDPPEFILDLYRKLQEGYDVVYAVRRKRNGENWFKLLTADFFYKLINVFSNTKIPLNTGDFRIFRRSVLLQLLTLKEVNRFLRGMIMWVGFKQTGIFYERDRRYGGKTKFSVSKMFRFAFDAITSFSTIPLKLSSFLGFIVAFSGFIYALYSLYVRFILNIAVQGWTSLIIIVLVLGGVQLLALGIIGEYIGRIYDEAKKRPLYIVEGLYQNQTQTRD